MASAANAAPGNVVVLDSDDDSREPTEEEVIEYAEFLGIDPSTEAHLMWIAREGVVAPIPSPWKACTENGDNVFYFNFETGDSVWDHPCDEKYRDLLEEERHKRIKSPNSSPGTNKHASSATAVSNPNDFDCEKGKHGNLDSDKDAAASSTEEATLEDAPCSITPTPTRSGLKDFDCKSGDEASLPVSRLSVPTVLLTEPEEETKEASPSSGLASSPSARQPGKLTIPAQKSRSPGSPQLSPRCENERGEVSPAGSGKSEGLASELSDDFDLGEHSGSGDIESRRGSVSNRRDSLAYSENDTPVVDRMDSCASFHIDSDGRKGSPISAIPENVEDAIVGSAPVPEGFKYLEDELMSLTRTLCKLREIRGHQFEYLQFLRNGVK